MDVDPPDIYMTEARSWPASTSLMPVPRHSSYENAFSGVGFAQQCQPTWEAGTVQRRHPSIQSHSFLPTSAPSHLDPSDSTPAESVHERGCSIYANINLCLWILLRLPFLLSGFG